VRQYDSHRDCRAAPGDGVLAAIELLKAIERDGSLALPKRPPASFLPPKWRKLIFAKGAADRRLYETAVLATLRDRLREPTSGWLAAATTASSRTTSCRPESCRTSASAMRPIPTAKWRAAVRPCTNA
jgi:hypothetical protein